MKKITIGIVVLFSLISINSLAASTSVTKKDASIPCYNGGYTFGLAGYYTKQSPTRSDANSTSEVRNSNELRDNQTAQAVDYR